MSGNAEIWHGNRHFLMEPGRMFLIPPKANMKFRCRESCEIIWLHFNLQVVGYGDLFGSGLCTLSQNIQNSDIVGMTKKLLGLLEKNDRSATLRAWGIFLQIISGFFLHEVVTKSPKETMLLEKFEPVIKYISSNCEKK